MMLYVVYDESMLSPHSRVRHTYCTVLNTIDIIIVTDIVITHVSSLESLLDSIRIFHNALYVIIGYWN